MRLRWKEVSPYSGKEIEEDAPANWAGGGNVHGIGVGPYGEPGIDPKKKKKHQILVDRSGRVIDGRTKSYREHRKKLESAREKREQTRTKSKFIEKIKKKSMSVNYG